MSADISKADRVFVKASELVADHRVQSRCEIDEDYCQRLAKEYDYERDRELPVVFRNFSSGHKLFVLASGFQRRHALLDIKGDKGMWCLAVNGDLDDATLFSVGCNAESLRERTLADKLHAVTMLLKNAKWSGWSVSAMAKQCRVHRDIVERAKKDHKDARDKADRKKAAAAQREQEKKVGKPISLAENAEETGENEFSLADTASEGLGKEDNLGNGESVRYTTKHGTTATMSTSRIGKTQPKPKLRPGDLDKMKKQAKGHSRKLWRECEALALHLPQTAGELFAAHMRWAEEAEDAARHKRPLKELEDPA